jgi:hypothetical protein
MDLATKTTHTITFQVYACWTEEGGMDDDYFGKRVDRLPQALRNLELARVHDSTKDWFIKTEVETKTHEFS